MLDNNDHFEPIFVVGAPRSGTTLLTVMLDRHDNLVMTPETRIFADLPLDWRSRKAQTHQELIDSFRYRTHLLDLNLKPDIVLESFHGCEPTYQNYVRCVLECYRHRFGKLRIGEKSPEHLFDVPLILEWYPSAKIIWLVRDGCDNAMTIDRFFHNGLPRSCFFWRMCALLGLRWERAFPSNVLRTRYEDLVLRPAETLAALCRFVKVPFQDKMLDTSIKTFFVPEHELAHKKSSFAPLDAAKVGEHRHALTNSQRWLMISIMEPVLRLLGYPPIEAPPRPFFVRSEHALSNVLWSFVYNPVIMLNTARSPTRLFLGRLWKQLSVWNCNFKQI